MSKATSYIASCLCVCITKRERILLFFPSILMCLLIFQFAVQIIKKDQENRKKLLCWLGYDDYNRLYYSAPFHSGQ